MSHEFTQVSWDERLEDDLRRLFDQAIEEDLDSESDWTSLALIPADVMASAEVVCRQPGTLAGMYAGTVLAQQRPFNVRFVPLATDGTEASAGQVIARLDGNARDLLVLERTLLNVLGRLCGIATLTAEYVRRVAGTRARVFDTRKTLPGWRRLEKYAVRCGGGFNHRLGLWDAILIKDNHLCQMQQDRQSRAEEAVRIARSVLSNESALKRSLLLEIELDSLEPLRAVLAERPDVILLDNFPLEDLRQAVAIRDTINPTVQLEASGGVNLQTIAAIASSGVDRISIGAITHSAPNFDVALDWIIPNECGALRTSR